MRITVDPQGFVTAAAASGRRTWRAALGRGGITTDKREGDGATPAGLWHLGRVFYRPDRLDAPETGLPTVALQPDWGWCDDPDHPDYNTRVTLPHPARHEDMWREDGLYDVVVEVHYNTSPIVPGGGSAIFLHVAKPDYSPTEGCIALKLDDLLDLLRKCNEEAALDVPPGPA